VFWRVYGRVFDAVDGGKDVELLFRGEEVDGDVEGGAGHDVDEQSGGRW